MVMGFRRRCRCLIRVAVAMSEAFDVLVIDCEVTDLGCEVTGCWRRFEVWLPGMGTSFIVVGVICNSVTRVPDD